MKAVHVQPFVLSKTQIYKYISAVLKKSCFLTLFRFERDEKKQILPWCHAAICTWNSNDIEGNAASFNLKISTLNSYRISSMFQYLFLILLWTTAAYAFVYTFSAIYTQVNVFKLLLRFLINVAEKRSTPTLHHPSNAFFNIK